jgi:hypothetical protein
VPASAAESFAAAWLLNWLNYSPRTAREVYARALGLMAPSLAARVQAGLEDELAKITREMISCVFTLGTAPRAEMNAGGFRVRFTGERSVYVGREELSREGWVYVLEVRRAPLTVGNPYGLVIWDVTRERVRDAAL